MDKVTRLLELLEADVNDLLLARLRMRSRARTQVHKCDKHPLRPSQSSKLSSVATSKELAFAIHIPKGGREEDTQRMGLFLLVHTPHCGKM